MIFCLFVYHLLFDYKCCLIYYIVGHFMNDFGFLGIFAWVMHVSMFLFFFFFLDKNTEFIVFLWWCKNRKNPIKWYWYLILNEIRNSGKLLYNSILLYTTIWPVFREKGCYTTPEVSEPEVQNLTYACHKESLPDWRIFFFQLKILLRIILKVHKKQSALKD